MCETYQIIFQFVLYRNNRNRSANLVFYTLYAASFSINFTRHGFLAQSLEISFVVTGVEPSMLGIFSA